MTAHSTTTEPAYFEDRPERRLGLDLQRVEYIEGPSCQCHSTIAVIQHAEDDDEEVTSKTTPPPKKSL